MFHWEDWNYFLGEWIGEGTGEPGEGRGGFRFDFDLQGQILVRRNFAEYPATAEQPSYRHDDLMIIFQDPQQRFRATYWDNEGHIIRYTVEFSQDKNILIFLGDTIPTAPRFRFTYNRLDDRVLGIKFEIALPGRPEEFAPYIEARAQRKRHN